MQIISFLSVFLVPFVIFYIVLDGVFSKTPVFESFIEGAKQGFKVVINITPTIIGLFVAIGIFRNSNALDFMCKCLSPIAKQLSIPTPLIPLSILKTFSSSGANGLLFDIFKSYGTDSYIGFSASILLSCTETLFYTISIYYMSVDIKKSRWTIPVGIIISIFSLVITLFVAHLFLPK